MKKRYKRCRYFRWRQKAWTIRSGDVVAWIGSRWQIGIVLKVFEPNDPAALDRGIPRDRSGFETLFDGGGIVTFDSTYPPDDELIFLQGMTWYDEKDWMICEKMKSVDEVMKHFGVERMWGN